MFAKSCLLVPVLLIGVLAQQVPTLRTQSNVVIVPALVRSADGSVLYGLKAEDFVIEDDGVEQQVHLDDSVEMNQSRWSLRFRLAGGRAASSLACVACTPCWNQSLINQTRA
jgi:hypothetical protein